MFTLEMIKNELNKLSNSVGDTFDIPVSVNARLTRTLGRVMQYKQGKRCWSDRMEFSKQFLETSTDESIISVIQHEWAHYYVTKITGENHGHDAEFKRVCAMIGCTNDKTETKVERTVAEETLSKYVVYCPSCGEPIGGFSRMCSTLKNLDSCTCGKCGSGDLYYVQNWQEVHMEQTIVELTQQLLKHMKRAEEAEEQVHELNIELMEREYRITKLEEELKEVYELLYDKTKYWGE